MRVGLLLICLFLVGCSTAPQCGQQAYGDPGFCEGLTSGHPVPSCDCNTCACVEGVDGELFVACTEVACG